MNEEKINYVLEKLKEDAQNVGKEMADEYKQKLVYKLLNALKVGDQSEFLWVLLRAINDPKKESNRNLANSIREAYNFTSPEIFEKIGYSIILGIMYSNKRGD